MDYEMILAWVIVYVATPLVIVPAIGYPFVSCGGRVKYSEALLFGCFLLLAWSVSMLLLLVVLWAFFKVMTG